MPLFTNALDGMIEIVGPPTRTPTPTATPKRTITLTRTPTRKLEPSATAVLCLAAPELTAPSDGAERYQVEIWHLNPGAPRQIESTLAGTHYTLLQAGSGESRWHVRACAGQVCGPWSAYRSLQTDASQRPRAEASEGMLDQAQAPIEAWIQDLLGWFRNPGR